MTSFSLLEMWHTMGLPARIVAVLLAFGGLTSLTVFIERILALRKSRAAARKFAAETSDDLHAGHFEPVIAEAAKYPQGHLPRMVRSALATYSHARSTSDGTGLPPLERMRRHIERHLESLGADMRRNMWVLASVGSIAPFVGLLGTVLGIISAFQGIAATGSGGLSSVSAGISEALVETALGLAVAIPAVLAFNWLSTRIGSDELALTTSAGELIDLVEHLTEDLSPSKGQELRRERVA
jgi:biopolymer transport protein ExbB